MIVIALVMLAILTAAGLVVAYVAYPQRGREVPKAPWLGEAMTRAAIKAGVHEENAPEEQRVHR